MPARPFTDTINALRFGTLNEDLTEKLTMSFELVRPHKILEDAVANTVKRIAEGTGRPVFRGNATPIAPISI